MILFSEYEGEKRNSFFPFTPHARISEPWNANSTWQYILYDQKILVWSPRHRSVLKDWNLLLFVEAACLVVGKERIKGKDGRNTCKKKWNYWSLISVAFVLVSLLSSEPLCISTENTVRNGTSAHLSCSATSFPHSCSKEFISSHCFTFHTGNFSQDPLPWGLCPALSTKPAHRNHPLLIFFFLFPFWQFLQVV